jgi:hypothetical protein
MQTDIAQLGLTLPAGFADRAPAIVRLLGAALAAADDLPGGRLARVDVGRLHIDARQDDRAIALAIAGAIHQAIDAAAAAAGEGRPCSRR